MSSILCKRLYPALRISLVLFLAPLPSLASAQGAREGRIALTTGWVLQSSCSVSASGDRISTPDFSTRGWHHAKVPSTVVAALVADGTYPDPYFSDNLRRVPGATYPIGHNFSRLPMPENSPFNCPWWYRIAFEAAPSSGKRVWLHFGGINNRANIWLNGRKIADSNDVAGAYRTYDFDITSILSRRGPNVLAVEVIAQSEKDLGINWVDWNPAPPDKDMGLWRGVYLRKTGPVAVRYPQVVTHFPDNSIDRADLTVEAGLQNASESPVSGTLEASLEGFRLRQEVALRPGESRTVRFAPEQYRQLQIRNPRLWWPRQMGAPDLHTLAVRFLSRGETSDSVTTRFGIREITSSLDSQNHRFFLINEKKILIRGGGWAPDMLLRQDDDRLRTEFRYVRDLNLNTIRLEGKLESDYFYDLADEQGVLIMAGWCCCDFWEEWQKWQPGDLAIATASLRSQIMRMRGHPSMLVWLNGSDNPPPADVEKAYIQVLRDSDWSNPYISSASQKPASLTGPSGVKMTGPYDYVPPDYWSVDPGQHGGAWGFNTETSPGPAVPPESCLRKILPAGHIKPDDPLWNYHAGSGGFKDLTHFEQALTAIYGAPSSFDDYERKAQAMAYDGERAMFESYSARKYAATGVIQWMLNNAWPSLIWHLYDYYLQPAGGYFGAKKACEPLHVQYSYNDRSIEVVNSRYEDAAGLTVDARLYDSSLHERFSRKLKTSVAADAVARALALPEDAFNPPSPVYFVRLALDDREGRTVSRNFYWLSSKKTVYDWAKTTYRFTPVSSYEDMTALQSLPKAGPLKVEASVANRGEEPVVRVAVHNPSKHLAFQVHLAIRHLRGEMEILPVLWEDNYFELMPGESRDIEAQFLSHEALRQGARLVLTGWNFEPVAITLNAPAPELRPGNGGE